MNRLVDGLYIFIMCGLLFLSVYEFLFGGVEMSDFEEMCIMIFVAVLSIAMACCVILEKKDKEDNDGSDV